MNQPGLSSFSYGTRPIRRVSLHEIICSCTQKERVGVGQLFQWDRQLVSLAIRVASVIPAVLLLVSYDGCHNPDRQNRSPLLLLIAKTQRRHICYYRALVTSHQMN